jgi:hypothetical protein
LKVKAWRLPGKQSFKYEDDSFVNTRSLR